MASVSWQSRTSAFVRFSALPLSVVGFLVIWHFSVVILDIRPFILPSPVSVAKALWRGVTEDPTTKTSLLYMMGITLKGALAGYAFGATAGILLGILAGESQAVQRIVLPWAFVLQSVPKIAIAPLIMIWFGYGTPPAIVLSALLVFFPCLLNTHRGMTMIERDYLLLMRGLRASRWQTLIKLKLPTALPLMMVGLDLGVVFALLGVIVSEFVASQAGIGVAILQYQYINNTAGVFAALVVLAVVANLLHFLVAFADRKLVFWSQSDASEVARASR